MAPQAAYRVVASLIFGATLLITPTPVIAAERFISEYAVSAIGLRVGKTQFRTTITDRTYAVSGTLDAAGFASLFSSMSGKLNVQGRRAKTALIADGFTVRYQEKNKKKSTSIRFRHGNVTDVANKPASKPKPNWVPHKSDALRNTTDPVSAMLVPATSLRDVCTKSVRVFDGEMRSDVKLSYLRTIKFRTDGYAGDAVTCRASFKPVSGYQSTKKDIIYTRDKGDIEISFAPVGETGLYAPVAANVQTRIGQINVRATQFARND